MAFLKTTPMGQAPIRKKTGEISLQFSFQLVKPFRKFRWNLSFFLIRIDRTFKEKVTRGIGCPKELLSVPFRPLQGAVLISDDFLALRTGKRKTLDV